MISRDNFKLGLIEFYSSMNGFVFDKLSTCNCLAYLEVLKDTFSLMARLCIL